MLIKSTKVNLLVEHRSLYATYGKVHGRFLDQADKWALSFPPIEESSWKKHSFLLSEWGDGGQFRHGVFLGDDYVSLAPFLLLWH